MRVLLLPVLLLLFSCQSRPTLPVLPQLEEPGQIVDLQTGQRLSPDELIARLAAAPRVIVGEQHDHPDHHRLQLWLLQALAARRPQGSLLLEMLTPEQQPKVDGLRQAMARQGLPADLPKALAWQPGWDWSLYGPIVSFALVQPYPLWAANLDRLEVRGIYATAPVLSGSHANAPSVRQALLAQVRTSHCGLLPEAQLPAMLAVQQQRDRRMAQRLLDAPTPALLFAGAFHARKDVGVPVHLADLPPPRDAVVLMLAQRGAEVMPATADYVWYTAPMVDKDYCAQLR